MVLLLLFMQLTRDLFAIAKFLLSPIKGTDNCIGARALPSHPVIPTLSHCWKEDSMQYIYSNTFTAIVRGTYTGEAKMCKNVLKWRIFKLPAWITGKRLKIDRHIQDIYAFHSNYGSICTLQPFWRYSTSKNGLTLKSGYGVLQGHWKRRGSIDHVWLSISPPL